MKVVPLRSPMPVYSGWAYVLLGDWNRLEDTNTLIDTGTDGGIVDLLPTLSTGIGKKPVELVLLTHSHFDHAGGVPRVVATFNCPVGAMAPSEGVTRILRDGDILRLADREGEVIACPEHSMDSMCIYVHGDGYLFSGDTPLALRSRGGTYGEDFLHFLRKLSKLPIRAIFSGHDEPIREGAQDVIRTTLGIVESSLIVNHSSG